MTPDRPGRLYAAVTRHWPRIAGGLVLLVGAAEYLLGGLTADGAVESYFFAWATVTGGLWFLFDKAESSLSEEGRQKASARLTSGSWDVHLASLPEQFAGMFDRIFGERHLSFRCALRSSVASVVAVLVILGIFAALSPRLLSFPLQAARELSVFDGGARGGSFSFELLPDSFRVLAGAPEAITVPAVLLLWLGQVLVAAAVLNIVPDYVSLLETRWLLGRGPGRRSFTGLLVLDAALTVLVSLGWIYLLLGSPGEPFGPRDILTELFGGGSMVTASGVRQPNYMLQFGFPLPLGLFFWSAFVTSVWLWLYALGTVVARALLRLGRGVGLLLRVTDVERQPLRSMGFVSVIIVSVLFLLGLPLVLVR